MAKVVALVRVDTDLSVLDRVSLLGQRVADRPVLHHTLRRLAAVPAVQEIVLVHPPGQDVQGLVAGLSLPRPVRCFAPPQPTLDPLRRRRIAARAWSLAAWRGGLGGATCYDELLPADDLHAAMAARQADSALLVGGDWMLVDPHGCQAVLAAHLEHPQNLPLIFSQAPPGLCGLAIGASLLRQLAQVQGGIGAMLAYNPLRPQADPIGRDVCVQVPAVVRSCVWRFIADNPRSMALIEQVAAALGDELSVAGAQRIAEAVHAIDPAQLRQLRPVPPQVTLELTPRRVVDGPITPQRHVAIDRPDMPTDLALRIIDDLAAELDLALTLGGLGDALLHSDWQRIVAHARAAGVLATAIDTDLVCPAEVVDRLLKAPVDVVSVRLNADTADVYRRAMGRDAFAQVIANLERLINGLRRRDAQGPSADGKAGHGLPWIVPRFLKTADTLPDMEGFFDKWTHFVGHAVIESPTSGCGLMADQSLHRMAPPQRFACRQLAGRMTILSDGQVAQCDQDWLGRGTPGSAATTPLPMLWRALQQTADAQHAGRWDSLPLCGVCEQWHRP